MKSKVSFLKQYNKSKPAVKSVADYLTKEGHSVIDTQDEQKYRDKDIDLILEGNPDISIEVKCDFHMEKHTQYIMDNSMRHIIKDKLHLYIEVISCVETGSKGWLNKSEADDIFYIHYRKGHLNPCHIFGLSELREWIKKNNPRIKKHPDSADGKTKRAYLIPISQIEQLKSYRRIYLPAFKV